MVTDEVEKTIATGIFPNHMEAEEFLEVLDHAGYNKHLVMPANIEHKGGNHVVVLHIKKYAQFLMMACLDGDGALEKWGDYFSFEQPLE